MRRAHATARKKWEKIGGKERQSECVCVGKQTGGLAPISAGQWVVYLCEQVLPWLFIVSTKLLLHGQTKGILMFARESCGLHLIPEGQINKAGTARSEPVAINCTDIWDPGCIYRLISQHTTRVHKCHTLIHTYEQIFNMNALIMISGREENLREIL